MNTHNISLAIQPQREALLNHSLYQKIKSIDDLNRFLENHVYAVWDFMSLLKALQSTLTCVHTPWMPVGDPQIRHLINEIVLAEETDLAADGSRLSHFEMYLDAMVQCGADTQTIADFLAQVKATQNIFVSIKQSGLHPKVKDFLDFSFRIIDQGKPHQIAAAFTFGREDLIPEMFTEMLRGFQAHFPQADFTKLIYYFERHIALDGDQHGPMAMQMISSLCGDSASKWKEAEVTALEALEKRIGLWDAIEEQIAPQLEPA